MSNQRHCTDDTAQREKDEQYNEFRRQLAYAAPLLGFVIMGYAWMVASFFN